MRKTLLSVMMLSALTVATTSLTSCKDYDDDINNLQAQIDANKKLIDQIQTLIQSGSVITKVESTSNGVKLTLSNGQSYELTNGRDGQPGAPGTAWTISDDGYWVKDGEKTTYKAIGKDGTNGTNGTNGKDGAVYVPNVDGYFHIYQDGKDTGTSNISWIGTGSITGLMDNDYVTLHNVKYPDGTYQDVKISLSNNLRGFSFVTDAADNDGKLLAHTIVDGVEAIQIQSYSFNALTLSKKDSKEETASSANNATVINPATYAYYKVEPAEASADDLQKLAYRVEANGSYIKTRAEASKDFAANAKFVSFKDGILKVQVDVTGTPATAEKISTVSLQATKRNNEVVEQSDDPETIYKNDLKDLRIADKKKFEADPSVDYHFRRFINANDAEAGAAVKTKPVWDTTDGSDADVEVAYDASVDLSEYVQAHILNTPHTDADLARLGMSFEYQLVKNYKIGTNNTDQADFASLSGSVLTPKVFSDAQRFAAVGRTPVVRVLLKHGDQIVKVAYIKVKIVKKEADNKTIDFTTGDFTFKCGEAGTVKTTVEQTNVQLYNACSMDRDEFHSFYKFFDAANNAEGNVGTVSELTETVDGETTHLLQWTITNDDLWKNAGKTVKHVVYYRTAQGSNKFVQITLTSNIKGIAKTYDIAKANFIKEYWNAEKTLAKFNVATPDAGSEDNTKCVFKNDLNSPFVTSQGKLELPETEAGTITSYNFYFDKSMESVTKVGDINVKFTVENGTTLKATVDGQTETVATISNNGTAVPYNYVELNKNSNIAKELLNTNAFDVNYGVEGVVCSDANKKVAVTFNGKSYFTARFVRPVNITAVASDNFIDAVDFGSKGSYIALEDLIAPSDWRNYKFTEHTNYWKYYGPFTITADLEHAKCNLNGVKQAVPATIVLKQEAAGTMGTGNDAKTSSYGFITYKNNGTVTDGFELYIPVTVNYGWGTIQTEPITVKVAKTVNQAKKY
jgi:hypothetical protein